MTRRTPRRVLPLQLTRAVTGPAAPGSRGRALRRKHESASGAAGGAASQRRARDPTQVAARLCATKPRSRARKHARQPRTITTRRRASPRRGPEVATHPPAAPLALAARVEIPRALYPSFSPASTRRYCPVTMRVRSLANSTATSATSSSGGISRIGKRFEMCAMTASSLVPCSLACHFT